MPHRRAVSDRVLVPYPPPTARCSASPPRTRALPPLIRNASIRPYSPFPPPSSERQIPLSTPSRTATHDVGREAVNLRCENGEMYHERSANAQKLSKKKGRENCLPARQNYELLRFTSQRSRQAGSGEVDCPEGFRHRRARPM